MSRKRGAGASATGWVVPLDEVLPGDAAVFGAKCAGLGALRRAGFPVPEGFAISGEAFAHHVERALGASWWVRRHRLPSGSDPRRAVAGVELLPDFSDDVRRAYRRLGRDRALVAVRSSSTAEDRDDLSAAGVQHTVLGVRTVEGVLEALREVWASLFSDAALAYLDCRRASSEPPVLVGVLVQPMLRPDAAGVLFTENPVTGDENEIVVNSTFGLGEPVLAGRVSPDTYVLDKSTLEIRHRSVATKGFSVTVEDGLLSERALEPGRARAASLSEAQAVAVGDMGRRVERALGGPRDVEWAVVGDEVHLLQARPVTARGKLQVIDEEDEAPPGRPGDIWSNANVGEALPGVATPLTWSIAARYSDQGFREAFRGLGCEVPDGAVLVGRFRGRIYLNLTQFIEIAAQVPFLDPRILAEVGGATFPEGFSPPPPRGDVMAGARFLARLPGSALTLLRQHVAMARDVEAVEARVSAAARRLQRRDLSALSSADLARELENVDELLAAVGDVMLTCGAGSLGSFLVVRALVRWWLDEGGRGLERELLAGAADLESAKPGIDLWLIAEALRADPESTKVLLDEPLEELSVESFPPGSRIRRDLEAFQAAHGYRGVREAELSTPRWSEDPTIVFAVLREYLRSGGPPPGRAVEARLEARRRAWARVERSVGPLRQSALRHLVAAARRYSRLRERLRARVTQVLGLYRTVALEVSRRIGHPDAAFFLTIEEIYQYLNGTLASSTGPSLGQLVAARRQRYELDRSLPDPPPAFVGRPPLISAAAPASSGRALLGLSASPGCATGEARVLLDVRQAGDLRAGEILVVPCADVGWSPLFLLAGAVVTELGGVLSHAAVVAREYGVPAVVGVTEATRIVETGQVVTVDGDAGLVTIHEND